MIYALSKTVTFALLPPGLFILAFGAGLVLLLAGRRKAGLVVVAATTVLLTVLSLRVSSDALIRPLEDAFPPVDFAGLAEAVRSGGPDAPVAVVVLGGGYVERSPEEGMGASLSGESAKRLSYGLSLARRTGLPLVFSGGKAWARPGIETEADAARRLLGEFGSGVEARYEEKSRTTLENAENLAAMLGKGARVVLVTSAYHMRRAVSSAEAAGLVVLPAPTDYRANRGPVALADLLPTMEAFRHSYVALHEWAGLAGYALAR